MNSIDDALDELSMERPRSNMVSCPKHSDSSPSLRLYDDHFYCFSCGATGDQYGLIALFTDKPIGYVLSQWRKNDKQWLQRKTKGIKKADVALSIKRRYSTIHRWFFSELHRLLKDEPDWKLFLYIETWGEYFDDLRDHLTGEGMYDEDDKPSPYQADKILDGYTKELQRALEVLAK